MVAGLTKLYYNTGKKYLDIIKKICTRRGCYEKNVVFVGEENKINNELYQMLNWRFKVDYYNPDREISLNDINVSEAFLVLVSMVGNNVDYRELFTDLQEKWSELPVVTVSTRAESEAYAKFYETKQFHKVLRPVTGRIILEVCRTVIDGGEYVADGNAQKRAGKQHILVVDDNAMVLRNIKSILEQTYSVAVAPSGVHAFISVGKKMPDLILLDYDMPEMNGKEVLEKLSAEKEFADIPIVFLTSMDSKEIVMELLALRPAGYILKPVDSRMLLERIEDIIGK